MIYIQTGVLSHQNENFFLALQTGAYLTTIYITGKMGPAFMCIFMQAGIAAYCKK